MAVQPTDPGGPMGSKVLSYHDSDSVGDSSKLFDQNFSFIGLSGILYLH